MLKITILLILLISIKAIAGKPVAPMDMVVDADYFCKKIESIKHVPFKSEITIDSIYNGLLVGGARSVSCLIPRLAETKMIESPILRPPFRGSIPIGLLAQYLINRIIETPEWAKNYRLISENDRAVFEKRLSEWFAQNRLMLTNPEEQSRCFHPETLVLSKVCTSAIPEL